MKSSVHLGLQYQQNLAAYRNTNFEELTTLFDITLRLIVEQSFEIQNVSTMIIYFLSLGEIYSVSRTSNQVGESKGTCLPRLSLVWERCMVIQKRMKSEKARSDNSNNPTSTQSCLESTENRIHIA